MQAEQICCASCAVADAWPTCTRIFSPYQAERIIAAEISKPAQSRPRGERRPQARWGPNACSAIVATADIRPIREGKQTRTPYRQRPPPRQPPHPRGGFRSSQIGRHPIAIVPSCVSATSNRHPQRFSVAHRDVICRTSPPPRPVLAARNLFRRGHVGVDTSAWGGQSEKRAHHRSRLDGVTAANDGMVRQEARLCHPTKGHTSTFSVSELSWMNSSRRVRRRRPSLGEDVIASSPLVFTCTATLVGIEGGFPKLTRFISPRPL